ncbi:hypothetical protein B2J88_07860 [Rhodococcus sp. SRB_17]|nr:hypothetical protein [Rhodococcus sp. SRB_17]
MTRTILGAAITALAFGLVACGSSDSDTVATEENTSTHAVAATTTATKSASERPELTDAQTDKVFLQVLESYDINYGASEAGGDAAAIKVGKSICDGLGRGLSQTDILPNLMDKGPEYNLADATNFINTSIAAYCPDEA